MATRSGEASRSFWRRNPHLRLICVVPISKDGNTGEMRDWYEQHLFPDTSPPAKKQEK